MTASPIARVFLPGYPDTLGEYIALGREDTSVDFKREYDLRHDAEEIAKDICAIANSYRLHGSGFIIVGVLDSDQREAEPDDPPVPGLKIAPDERKRFRSIVQNICHDHIDPRLVPDIDFPLYSDVRIAIIKIVGHNRPYKVFNTKGHNGIWIRVGDSCQVCDAETVMAFFQEHFIERARLEIITRMIEKLVESNTSLLDIINFLIDNIRPQTPDALHARALLFRRIDSNDLASRDLISAISLLPAWTYIRQFTEINFNPVKELYNKMDVSGVADFDIYDLRDIENILHSNTKTLEEEDYIARAKQDLDRMQEVVSNIGIHLKKLEEILDILDKTPQEQRDNRYQTIRQEVDTLDKDMRQRYYQLEKRIKKALAVGL